MSDPYEVQVAREGRWWLVRIPALDEVTQTRRVADAERMAKEVIALHTGRRVEDVAVELTVEVGGEAIGPRLDDARSERAEADRLEARAAATYRALSKELAAHDVPVRDIGHLLGISFQRAHQIVSG